MMLLSSLQIYLWYRVTLTFDRLLPKVDHSMPLPHGPCVPIDVEICSFILYSKYHVHKSVIDGRINGEIEKIMSRPASLAWQRCNYIKKLRNSCHFNVHDMHTLKHQLFTYQSINGICKAPLTKLDSGAGQK